MPALNLIDPPRLYVNADTLENLKDKLHSPYLKAAAQRVIHDAENLVDAPPLREKEIPSYLGAGRQVRCTMECLTSAWVLTRDRRYRAAALRHLAGLREWNHISCEANIAMPPDAERFYCLMYGEYSAAVALMYVMPHRRARAA